jgi:hypothetical protein
VGKKRETKTFESVTEFFEAQFNQNKNNGNGMLKHMELKHAQMHGAQACQKTCSPQVQEQAL